MCYEMNTFLLAEFQKPMLRQVAFPPGPGKDDPKDQPTQQARKEREVQNGKEKSLRVKFHLIDYGTNSGNVKDALRLQHIEIRQPFALFQISKNSTNERRL